MFGNNQGANLNFGNSWSQNQGNNSQMFQSWNSNNQQSNNNQFGKPQFGQSQFGSTQSTQPQFNQSQFNQPQSQPQSQFNQAQPQGQYQLNQYNTIGSNQNFQNGMSINTQQSDQKTFQQTITNYFFPQQQRSYETNSNQLGRNIMMNLFPQILATNKKTLTLQDLYNELDKQASKLCQQMEYKKESSKYWHKIIGQKKGFDYKLKQLILRNLIKENNLSQEQLIEFYQQKIKRQAKNEKTGFYRWFIASARKPNESIPQKKEYFALQNNFKTNLHKNFYNQCSQGINYNHKLYLPYSPHQIEDSQSDSFDQIKQKFEVQKIQKQILSHQIKTQKIQNKQISTSYNTFKQQVMKELCVFAEEVPIQGSYILHPSRLELQKMLVHQIRCVSNVEIKNNYGKIKFLEPINLFKANIESCVRINKECIEIINPEWKQKECEITYFDFGEFSKIPKLVSKKLEENEKKGQSEIPVCAADRKKYKMQKLIAKNKKQQKINQAKKNFRKKIKQWVQQKKYKFSKFDNKTGSLTVRL